MDDMKHKAKTVEHMTIEALDSITAMVPLARELTVLDSRNNLLRIGRAVCELHEIKDDIYTYYPELKPDVVKDMDEMGWEVYSERQKEIESAYQAEQSGEIERARTLFQAILERYASGYLRVQAEAGLYRCSPKIQ